MVAKDVQWLLIDPKNRWLWGRFEVQRCGTEGPRQMKLRNEGVDIRAMNRSSRCVRWQCYAVVTVGERIAMLRKSFNCEYPRMCR